MSTWWRGVRTDSGQQVSEQLSIVLIGRKPAVARELVHTTFIKVVDNDLV